MKGEHFGLNGNPGLLVAQQLRYQRQIEPLTRASGSAGDLRDQFVPQWTKIGPTKRHRREFGKSDPIRARIANQAGCFGALKLHGKPPLSSDRPRAQLTTRSST